MALSRALSPAASPAHVQKHDEPHHLARAEGWLGFDQVADPAQEPPQLQDVLAEVDFENVAQLVVSPGRGKHVHGLHHELKAAVRRVGAPDLRARKKMSQLGDT